MEVGKFAANSSLRASIIAWRAASSSADIEETLYSVEANAGVSISTSNITNNVTTNLVRVRTTISSLSRVKVKINDRMVSRVFLLSHHKSSSNDCYEMACKNFFIKLSPFHVKIIQLDHHDACSMLSLLELFLFLSQYNVRKTRHVSPASKSHIIQRIQNHI